MRTNDLCCLMRRSGRLLLVIPLLLALTLAAEPASASVEAKVFPVRGLFWDEVETKAIDQRFMKSLDLPKLSLQMPGSIVA